MTVDIGIDLPSQELGRRKARIAAAYRLENVQPTPVLPCFLPRYWLNILGVRHGDYFRSADLMLRTQLQARKWILENVRCDSADLTVYPDMCHHDEAWGLGCEVQWEDDLQPWIMTHPVSDERDIERLRNVDVADNRAIDFARRRWAEMRELAEGYRLRFSDGVTVDVADMVRMPAVTTGIFTLATDLRGSDIYLDLKLRPGFAHELMSAVTSKVFERLEYLRGTFGPPSRDTYICDDSTAVLSPADYREFVLPYNRRYKEHYGGFCTLHCDGRADHLLAILGDELGIDCFWSFGFQTNKQLVREHLGGKAVLVGNINPMNLFSGTPETVVEETLGALEAFAPCGGYIVMDGSNIAPGTPLENINAMADAAKIWCERHPA